MPFIHLTQGRDLFSVLSGYHSSSYDQMLTDWTVKEFNNANNSSGAKVTRRMVECVWMNYLAADDV